VPSQQHFIRNLIRRSFQAIGFDVTRYRHKEQALPPDFRDEEIEIFHQVSQWTMTGPERIYALIQAVRYLCANSIPGAMVECGVWRGGSMAAIARTLLRIGDVSRDLYLFDTFEGMSEPTAHDSDYEGQDASELLRANPDFKCAASLEVVRSVLYDTGYPKEKICFVRGKVEETVPSDAPQSIALLRLDTDWYASTKHELVHLYPRVSQNGVIIIDDYGHWEGSRQACDEFFAENQIPILLNRIDYTGRMGVKIGSPVSANAEHGILSRKAEAH